MARVMAKDDQSSFPPEYSYLYPQRTVLAFRDLGVSFGTSKRSHYLLGSGFLFFDQEERSQ